MKISVKTKYALILMLDLAASYDSEKSVSIKAVAEREKISSKFLEQIVTILKFKQLVRAQRGSKGGYKLAIAPDQMDLKTIFEAVQGPISQSASDAAFRGTDSVSQWAVDDLFTQMNLKISEYLSSQNLADLLRVCQGKNLSTMFYI